MDRGYRHPFLVGTHFLGGVGGEPRTLAELAMSQLSFEIRSQKDWSKLYQNQRDATVSAALQRVWKVRTPSSWVDVSLSKRQVDYVQDELAGYVALRDESNRCQVSCFERIWESNDILEPPILSELNARLTELSHSRSTRQASDLIDPCLCPLVYDKTLVSTDHTAPRPHPPPALTDIYTLSQKFALLPTEVFSSAAGFASFLSYISDLDPQCHSELYELLSKALSGFIPLFEHTLTDLHRNNANSTSLRIPGSCRYTIWDEPDPPEFSDDEEGWATYERDMRQWAMKRPIELPDVPVEGYQGGLELRKHRATLRSKRLQVIVRVQHNVIGPGEPEFNGTPWGVEGMKNERIVACGLYFASMENIQDSSIEFRMAVTYPRGFNAGDSGATLRTWGLRDGDSCHQHIGSVAARPGLGLVFPNIYQHRYTSFKLVDLEKEGHQTVVTFMLVDPDIQPIISTAKVPPQEKAWVARTLHETLYQRLPVELVEKILEFVEGLVEEEEAVKTRALVMAERTRFRIANDIYHFSIPFDVWNGPEVIH
ncbi:hypothetical protein C8J56DRAFT_950766 [Mycena floridula]|nr:hypothetical protein C8J56DRAFT_950766 [Mycena floridula]